MKIWQKTRTWDFGQTLLEWRRRDYGRFGSKLFSWLLGAFVFGILTSILFMAVGQPDWAQPWARVVFFVVFIFGTTSSFFRCVVHGFNYKITQTAMVHVHPHLGWEKLDTLLGKMMYLFGESYLSINWKNIKEIREQKGGILIILENGQEEHVPVIPVLILTLNLKLNSPEPRSKSRAKGDRTAYDKEVLRMVIKAARDAHRAAIG
jgi:hypothetical protein